MRAARAIGAINAVIIASVATLAGCAESSFLLAPESPLPAWFQVPPDEARADVSVKLDYYLRSTGRDAKFALVDARGHQLAAKQAALRGLEPLTLQSSVGRCPSYEMVTVGDVTEVLEHRRMEPVFYFTDEPGVLKQLGVSREQRVK